MIAAVFMAAVFILLQHSFDGLILAGDYRLVMANISGD
jgi:hypothetical protein